MCVSDVCVLCQAHEVLALEMMHVLMETPTNDSIELAIAFLKECGQRLTEVSPRGITGLSMSLYRTNSHVIFAVILVTSYQ